ncbi:MAG: hypothetical protein H6622_05725 [Halobacteriovoraceae bacterium]|nr:hypothetical protein [Halobacteriovoraceae bacterium]
MNVVVSCDHILERDSSIPIVEEVVENLVPTQIFTLAHNQGQVLGHLEQFKINSSFLSNICKRKSDLFLRPYLLNSAAKSLHICCSTDLIFNVSSGLSQGIKKCDGVRQITYLIDYPFMSKPKQLSKKIFWKYLQFSFINSLKKIDELWVASEVIKEIVEPFYDGLITVVKPHVEQRDYPLFPVGQFKKQTYMVLAEGLSDEFAYQVGQFLLSTKRDFRFVGRDDHLVETKKKFEANTFIGWKCAGELAPILASAKGTIDFEKCSFPLMGLQSLMCGTQVLTMNDPLKDEFYKNDLIIKFEKYSNEEFERKLVEFESLYVNTDPQLLRSHALQFSQSTLKRKLAGIRIKIKRNPTQKEEVESLIN